MPRERKMGKCTVCGQEKPLFDVKNQVCGACSGKKGGRPPKAIVKEPEKKPDEKVPLGTATGSGRDNAPAEKAEYLCDSCDAPVRYGQHKCGNCGTWIDWRGSPVQDDPHLVVCPECGAICGHTDQDVVKCPKCNFGG